MVQGVGVGPSPLPNWFSENINWFPTLCVETAKAYTYSFMGFARGPAGIDGLSVITVEVSLIECS